MAEVKSSIFVVDEDLCYGCGACIALCPTNALDLVNRLAIVNQDDCTLCNHCILFLSRIRTKYCRCKLMINISGGGLRGLSCALYLLNSGYNVTIYETRQEIGNPVRSPGIIKTIPEDFIDQTAAKQNSFGWAFRREWFEKLLAKKILDCGGIIKLKTEAPDNALNCTEGSQKHLDGQNPVHNSNLFLGMGGL